MHTHVPRHARVSNFEVTVWLTADVFPKHCKYHEKSSEPWKKSCVSAGVASDAVAMFFTFIFLRFFFHDILI